MAVVAVVVELREEEVAIPEFGELIFTKEWFEVIAVVETTAVKLTGAKTTAGFKATLVKKLQITTLVKSEAGETSEVVAKAAWAERITDHLCTLW